MAQADTIIPGGVQGLDRYAYVNNSPMNFVDPSGHEPHTLGSCYDYVEGECGYASYENPKTMAKPANRGAFTGLSGQGGAKTNSPEVVAVPAPVPPGSSPVPTLTEVTQTVSTQTEVTIIDYNVPQQNGISVEPQLPLLIPYVSDVLDWFDVKVNDVSLDSTPLFSDMKITTEITTTTTTKTVIDQYGGVISSDTKVTIDTISTTEYYRANVWISQPLLPPGHYRYPYPIP